MDSVTIRLDPQRKRQLDEAARKTGLTRSDLIRLALEHSPRASALRLVHGRELGGRMYREMLTEKGAAQTVSVGELGVGSYFVFDDKAYQVVAKTLRKTGRGFHVLARDSDSQNIELKGHVQVEIPDRLSAALPPHVIAEGLTQMEMSVVLALREQPQILEQLYRRVAIDRRRHDPDHFVVQQRQLKRFVGMLLLGVVAAGLADFASDPMTSTWRLTDTGRQVANALQRAGTS